jgi:AcrR family transcriptional regulator
MRGVTPAARPLTRVAKRREKTRRALLDVALGLFYEKGIYWTKIEDITERADIGKGTFYQYFDTKEHLLAELLREGLDRVLLRMKDAVPASGRGLIRSIVESRLGFFLDHPEYLLLFHQVRGLLQLQTASSKELRDVYNLHLDQLAQLLKPVLQSRGKAGAGGRDLAIALAAFTSGLLTYHLVFGTVDEVKRRGAAIADQIEQGLLALI